MKESEKNGRNNKENTFYGLDGIDIPSFDKWSKVYIANFYGPRLPRRFSHPTVIYKNPNMVMMLRSIGGLSIDSLNDEEKEITAKALEKKLIKKIEDKLYPNILVFNNNSFAEFEGIIKEIKNHIRPICVKMVDEYIDTILDMKRERNYNQTERYISLEFVRIYREGGSLF